MSDCFRRCCLLLADRAVDRMVTASAYWSPQTPYCPPALARQMPAKDSTKAEDNTVRRPEDPRQMPAKDSAMALAKDQKVRIESMEWELANDEQKAVELIEDAIRQLPDGSLQAQERTLDGFRQATGVLRKLAHNLLANRNAIVTDFVVLRKRYREAAPIYRDGAKDFIEFSKSEPYGELQEQYRQLAETWNFIADKMEKGSDRVVEENKEMAETLKYLERITLFLDRLQQHFDSIPDLKSLKDREKYLENLRHFIKSFERFRELFREFDTALRSNAVAANLPSRKNSTPEEVAGRTNALLAQCQSPVFRIAMPFVGLPLLIGCCMLPVKYCRRRFAQKKMSVAAKLEASLAAKRESRCAPATGTGSGWGPAPRKLLRF